MKNFCDLHTHSTYSDGTLTPEQLVLEAKRINLGAIALTDHNTVAGLPDFLSAAEEAGVTAIPGIELTTEYRSKELHILALFLQPRHYAPITELVAEMMARKDQSNRELIYNLAREGIHLDYDAICAGSSNRSPNRAVIAAEMVRLGYCSSIKECFSRWLSPKFGHYIPPKRLDALETIRFIRSLGAVPVLAHPLLSLEAGELEEFLPLAVECGMIAMETHYSTFTQEQTRYLADLADHLGLRQSGGSDFHGSNKPDIQLGTGRGNLSIPFEFLANLSQF